ncbi:MAG: alpha-ketoglutarate-dependent dioxygenase AlkB [Proteobacteria bacterium]|nr:MAG: alpha-ketoglutarate-dependent dioxygenase AlkB [Pseudomonadota bacterium]
MNSDLIKASQLLPSHGECFYLPGVFTPEECEQLFLRLRDGVAWKQEPIQIFGKLRMQPRLTALIGDSDVRYRYSGIEMQATPWTEALEIIRTRIQSVTHESFAFALLNYYRDGQDSMGWHSDDERELGLNPTIASVSFGETRKFVLRRRADHANKISIELESGSLLLMRGETQAHWQHALPKTTRSHLPRINLTFRPWAGPTSPSKP